VDLCVDDQHVFSFTWMTPYHSHSQEEAA